MMRLFLVCFLVMFLTGGVGPWSGKLLAPRQAFASGEAICARWFRQKRYEQSARCFVQLVAALKGKRSDTQRFQAGLWLRNAAVALRRAAKLEKRSEHGAYLRERALRLLERYLRGSLYSTPTQKRIVENMKSGLESKIAYTDLTVLSGRMEATIRILGYRYKGDGKGSVTKRLRPGRYTVLVRYPKMPETARTVTLPPGQPQVLRFAPPKKRVSLVRERKVPKVKRKRSGLPWILVGVGAAAAVGGGALVLVGVVVTQGERDKLDAIPIASRTAEHTREIKRLHELAMVQEGVGWALVGVGVACVIGGVLWWSLSGPKQAVSSKTSRQRLRHARRPVERVRHRATVLWHAGF